MKKIAIKRTDLPNRTSEELMNDGWVFLDSKYENIVIALLNYVRSELDRLYWNKYQKEMDSPFDNVGADNFETEYLIIRAYNWDGNHLPNFDTDQLKVFWYKHSGRGLTIMSSDVENAEKILIDVLNKSIESINMNLQKGG